MNAYTPLVCSMMLSFCSTSLLASTPPQQIIKKKLILLVSNGGHGHISAGKAMQSLLGDHYTITTINPFRELLNDIDTVKKLTGGRLDGEDFYNALLAGNWLATTSFFATTIGPKLAARNANIIEQRITNFLKQEQADMLISLIPLINLPCSRAAQNCSLPFLIITLDGHLGHWTNQFEKITHPCWGITVGFDDKHTTQLLATKRTDASLTTHVTGFPLRDQFALSYSSDQLKKEWNIPTNKPVVLIMMGGCGSTRINTIVRELKKINKPLHLLVCIGRNKKLEKTLLAMQQHPDVSLSIIPFTEKIAQLMAMSDLIITKPGPTSVNEALHQNVPMLLDFTAGMLSWESANADWIEKIHGGARIKKIADLKKLVPHYLDPAVQQQTRHALASIPKHTFAQKIGPLIAQLLEKNESQLHAARMVRQAHHERGECNA